LHSLALVAARSKGWRLSRHKIKAEKTPLHGFDRRTRARGEQPEHRKRAFACDLNAVIERRIVALCGFAVEVAASARPRRGISIGLKGSEVRYFRRVVIGKGFARLETQPEEGMR